MATVKNQAESSGIQSVERALGILETLSKTTAPLGVKELSEELGINRTTIYGLLNTLIGNDYVIKVPHSGKYTVTAKMYTLSCSYPKRLPVVRYADPYMQELARKFRMTVHLGMLTIRNTVLLVNVAFPQNNVTSGTIFPLHASGLGKVMLAFLSKERQDELLDTELKKYTRQTITDPIALREELERIRRRGFGRDNGEYLEGTSCLAFPIFNEKSEVVAAMSVSGSENEVSAALDQIIVDGLRCSKQCSLEMGWQM